MLRRTALCALGGLFASACAGAAPPPPLPALPPLATKDLVGLVPSAGLAQLLLLKPRAIAQIPWLIPAIAKIAPETNLTRFSAINGLDLRQIPEAVLARFGDALEGAELELVRHHQDPMVMERLFQKRLVEGAKRDEDRPDLVRLSGVVGSEIKLFERLGSDVVAFQQGGSVARGPARIAALFAQNKLKKTPRALETDPLKGLRARFGDAPVIALAKGPFNDEWKRAGHGLLEASTGVGAAARPTAREHLGFAIALSGSFATEGAEAVEVLLQAWNELASSTVGHLLGLDKPIEPPLGSHSDDAIALSVEVEPNRFAEGLRALVSEDLEAIMKL